MDSIDKRLARLREIADSADCCGECIDWDKPTEKPLCPTCIAKNWINLIGQDIDGAIREAEASTTPPVPFVEEIE